MEALMEDAAAAAAAPPLLPAVLAALAAPFNLGVGAAEAAMGQG